MKKPEDRKPDLARCPCKWDYWLDEIKGRNYTTDLCGLHEWLTDDEIEDYIPDDQLITDFFVWMFYNPGYLEGFLEMLWDGRSREYILNFYQELAKNE